MGEDLDRLDTTVAQVLAAARAEETVRSRAPLQTVELRELLGERIAELRERHDLKPDALTLEPTQALMVQGDAAELGVVFRNLLENAIKYSENPVRVRVGIQRVAEARVQVEISDQGIGIPKKELRRIFRRFYRAGRDVQRQVSGLGLGLFVVRTLLRKHGGRIVALSEGAGRGSRFVVTLRSA
jgi:signal transduction histidine kinase